MRYRWFGSRDLASFAEGSPTLAGRVKAIQPPTPGIFRLAYSDYGALVLQTFHAMPHDVYLLHTIPSYPGISIIDTQAGRFPNGYVSSGVNAPESALTRKEAMRPDAWPAEKRNLSWGSRLKALGIGSEATLPVAVNCPVEVSTAKHAMLLWPRLGAYRNRPDAET